MSRQLRYFNDVGSIANWANAMNLVKNLLLDPLPEAPAPVNPQQPSSQPSSQHIFSAHSAQRTNPDHSITPPITTCFQPTKMKPLTQSPLRCSNYIPSKPLPLTLYTHSQPELFPTSSVPKCPKRRKITIPTSVEDHASPTNHICAISTSNSTLADIPIDSADMPMTTAKTMAGRKLTQGMHIWYGCYPRGSDKEFWAFQKFNGAAEFKILQSTPELMNPITVKKVATGEVFKIRLTDYGQLRF